MLHVEQPFTVAELSASHCGDYGRAKAILLAAAEAGADGFKLQTWRKGTMVLDHGYQIRHGAWAGKSLASLYQEAHTPWEWHEPLFGYARELGLIPFSSPFDRDSVDFLMDLGVDRFKIASFELVDLGLISYAARKGLPMIMATGMATFVEIERAVRTAQWAGCNHITLAKCTSAYPAPPGEANLETLIGYCTDLKCHIGLSDHSTGSMLAILATALGAEYIEKHLNLEDSKGPDGSFAVNKWAFHSMVESVRAASLALGTPSYGPTASESTELRRSLYLRHDLPAGQCLCTHDVVTARPALGMHPHVLPKLVGRKLARSARAGEPILEELFE